MSTGDQVGSCDAVCKCSREVSSSRGVMMVGISVFTGNDARFASTPTGAIHRSPTLTSLLQSSQPPHARPGRAGRLGLFFVRVTPWLPTCILLGSTVASIPPLPGAQVWMVRMARSTDHRAARDTSTVAPSVSGRLIRTGPAGHLCPDGDRITRPMRRGRRNTGHPGGWQQHQPDRSGRPEALPPR